MDEKIDFITHVLSKPHLKQMICSDCKDDDIEALDKLFNKDSTI